MATDDTLFDFALVGAGIAGASAAWALMQRAPQARTLLLERESQPGYHTTGRSAALYMASYGTPAIRALTRASRDFFDAPPPGFTEHPLLSPRGVRHVATAEQAPALAALHAELRALDPTVRRVEQAELLQAVPCLRPAYAHAGLAEDGACDIDVHALHQGYLRGFKAQGGQLLTDADLQALRYEQGAWTLQLADGCTRRARVLVNAAGAWADAVAALAGIAPIGLQPRRRSAFTFTPPEGTDASRWPAVVAVDESWYIKPDAGLLLGSPANADPVPPHDVVPEELDIALGIHRIEEATTLQIRRPRSTWAGLRSFVADGDMVIGAEPGMPAFFWLAAQGGYGIQSAPGAAALAASLVLGHPLPDELVRVGLEAAALAPARLRGA